MHKKRGGNKDQVKKGRKKLYTRALDLDLPLSTLPSSLMYRERNLAKRLELRFSFVRALPKASSRGLICQQTGKRVNLGNKQGWELIWATNRDALFARVIFRPIVYHILVFPVALNF